MTDTPAPIWQDIATAPKDGTSILLAMRRIHEHFGARIACGGWQVLAGCWWGSCGSGLIISQPTHWQPLPAPPTA